MSAFDAWMTLQLKAISGDAAAVADIAAVAAELGDHPTDAERAEVWQRMLQERAQKNEQPEEPEEPLARRPRLNTEDIEEVHHDDEGLPQMRMVNDKAPDGRLEGGCSSVTLAVRKCQRRSQRQRQRRSQRQRQRQRQRTPRSRTWTRRLTRRKS